MHGSTGYRMFLKHERNSRCTSRTPPAKPPCRVCTTAEYEPCTNYIGALGYSSNILPAKGSKLDDLLLHNLKYAASPTLMLIPSSEVLRPLALQFRVGSPGLSTRPSQTRAASEMTVVGQQRPFSWLPKNGRDLVPTRCPEP